MAGIAAHALIDMNAVIEVNEIGKVVDPVPDKRFAAAETFADRFEHGGACPNLRMTIHAGSSGRNAGKARNFHRSMAIAAIDAESANVVLMTEGSGLRPGHSGVGHIRGSLDLRRRPEQHGDDEDGAKDRGAGDGVRAAMKNLHRRNRPLQREIVSLSR